jgi:hypothetical protein
MTIVGAFVSCNGVLGGGTHGKHGSQSPKLIAQEPRRFDLRSHIECATESRVSTQARNETPRSSPSPHELTER